MKITKTANNKKRITISKKEWEAIGKTAGWLDKLDNFDPSKILEFLGVNAIQDFLGDLSSQRFKGMTLEEIARELEEEQNITANNKSDKFIKKSANKSQFSEILSKLISLGWGKLQAQETIEKLKVRESIGKTAGSMETENIPKGTTFYTEKVDDNNNTLKANAKFELDVVRHNIPFVEERRAKAEINYVQSLANNFYVASVTYIKSNRDSDSLFYKKFKSYDDALTALVDFIESRGWNIV